MDQTNKMHLTFSSPIEASDTGRRIISGQIVPYGAVGQTSVGRVIFERGSITISDVAKIKLNAQHNSDAPLGRMKSYQETSTGINASFQISESTKGTDALLMASEQLIDGLSIECTVINSRNAKDGTMIVSAAELTGVGLVESPAFAAAKVLQVLANEGEEEISDTTEVTEEIPTQNESEAVVDETTAPVTTEAAAAPVAAEASRQKIQAAAPYITSTVRHGITSPGRFTEHQIKANIYGNEESKLWLAAATDPKVVQAAADSIGTTNPAFNPVQYMKEFITNNNFGRPAIDALSKGTLPNSGMTFSIPKLSTAPTVAAVAESGTVVNTGMVSAYINGTVTRYSGANTVTLELLDRSSDNPLFFDELTTQMERAYLKATDAAVIAQLIAEGTAATTQAATAAGLQAFIATESAAAYAGTSYFAQNLVAGTGQWANILGYADTTGRSLYTATAPMNSSGNAALSSIKGNVLGADLYVDVNMLATSASDSMFLIVPEAATWYESGTSYFSVNVPTTGQVTMSIYGYGSMITKQATGIRRFVKSA